MNRRKFLAGVAATATITALPALRPARGELPRLSEDDPAARGLKYAHDASTLSEDVRPADRFCSNCQLYQGNADDDWAGCPIFAGKAVAAKGWCTAWVPRQTG